jgi:hypothetical protein
MSEPLKVFAYLSRAKIAGQTDRKLAESYLELQKLRQQIRVAECGRAIPIPARDDLAPRRQER